MTIIVLTSIQYQRLTITTINNYFSKKSDYNKEYKPTADPLTLEDEEYLEVSTDPIDDANYGFKK